MIISSSEYPLFSIGMIVEEAWKLNNIVDLKVPAFSMGKNVDLKLLGEFSIPEL